MVSALSDAKIGQQVRIVGVELDAEIARWLSAVGLFHGEEVVVLRRAALGGPLHLRVISGGEFAIGRELAHRIAVEARAA